MLKRVQLMKLNEVEQRAKAALMKCLEEVPFLQIKSVKQPAPKGPSPDLMLKLKLQNSEQLLLAEVKSSGQPKPTREAVNQLLRRLQLFPGAYGVVVAPYISPQAAAICWQAGLGYADLAGNCRLTFRQVYIVKDGRPNPFGQKRELRSLYSPKATRVLRVLLVNAGKNKRWKLQNLANEAEVSLGQASNVKKLLADREWIRIERDGFALAQPAILLDEWSQNYSYRRNTIRDFYALQTIPEIEAKLAQACRRASRPYALTGFSAAARLAPSVRHQRAMAYVQDGLDELAKRLSLKEVDSGANVSLLVPYDTGVFYGSQNFDGAQLASPIQVYLDLKSYPGRGEEAASVLLEQVIKPKW
jgi:hypothetical protein